MMPEELGVMGSGIAGVFGWALVQTVWQGALVAGALALALKLIPASAARVRSIVAGGALVVVAVSLAATTAVLVRDWREHDACWSAGADPAMLPPVCREHGVKPAGGDAAAEASRGSGREWAVSAWALAGVAAVPGRVLLTARGTTPVLGALAALSAVLSGLLLLRLAYGLALLQRIRRGATPIRDARTRAVVDRLARRLGMRAEVQVLETGAIRTPGLCGWRSPTILLPRGLTAALRPDELADILTHELAHARRRDFPIGLAQCALGSLLPWNPFVRWISRRAREEREVLCDAIAVAVRGHRACRRYARTLLLIERFRCGCDLPSPVVGLLGEGELLRRVRRLIEAGPAAGSPAPRLPGLALASAATLLAALLVIIGLPAAGIGSWAIMEEDIDRREAAAPPAGATPHAESAPGTRAPIAPDPRRTGLHPAPAANAAPHSAAAPNVRTPFPGPRAAGNP